MIVAALAEMDLDLREEGGVDLEVAARECSKQQANHAASRI